MSKTYKPQKGIFHGLLIWIPTFSLLIIFIIRMFDVIEIFRNIPITFLVFSNIIFVMHSATVWFMTEYKIKDDNLKIRFGVLMYWTIKVENIEQLEKTSSVYNSPSLSFEGLRIKRKKQQDIIISPENRDNFIQDLLQLNSLIKITGNKKARSQIE